VQNSSRWRAWAIASGAIFAYAWLVNPIVLFFPPLLALLLWRGHRRQGAAWLLAAFLLPVALWSVRNAMLPDGGSSERAKVNLVQGSWPQYHDAWKSSRINPISAE